MVDKQLDIITIGESLIEFSTNQKLKDAECLHKYYGGDSLVTAVSAKRLGSNVGFITCLGDDVFKDYLLSSWEKEELDTSLVRIVNEKNGLYMVSRAPGEAKEFTYYRKKIAPAKLSIEDIDENYLRTSKVVYASGITQSLSLSAKEAVKKAFVIAKDNGIITAYDPNFSKLITTVDEAKENLNEIIGLTDILFLSEKHDVKNLFDIDTIDNIIKSLCDMGVKTVVIKSSKDCGYYLNYQSQTIFVPFYTTTTVDTTSSGDSFNGGFLHAITCGYSTLEAVKIASITSGLQAQGIGAIKSSPTKDEVYNIYNSEG